MTAKTRAPLSAAIETRSVASCLASQANAAIEKMGATSGEDSPRYSNGVSKSTPQEIAEALDGRRLAEIEYQAVAFREMAGIAERDVRVIAEPETESPDDRGCEGIEIGARTGPGGRNSELRALGGAAGSLQHGGGHQGERRGVALEVHSLRAVRRLYDLHPAQSCSERGPARLNTRHPACPLSALPTRQPESELAGWTVAARWLPHNTSTRESGGAQPRAPPKPRTPLRQTGRIVLLGGHARRSP